MGQKVHPYGLRLGIIKSWKSTWYQDKGYAKWLHEDLSIRRYVKKQLMHASIADVEIERAANKCKVIVRSSRPGIIIGKKGAGADNLKKGIQRLTSNEVFVEIQEVRKAEITAQLVAENIATQLERRVSFRRAMKRSLSIAMKFGAKGIRLECSGRLGGAEMSRREKHRAGRVPLHTLRADIDYGFAEARTTYGIIGVKAWIFKGEVFKKAPSPK